ncbi:MULTISPECIES: DUF2357 domain-containing protein [Psychrobacter]|uniref:DUF2357 domain-containing protein n=1 Tax=Psychrobacter alimentarius TaxID=261164 RepID=A0ABM5ZWY5_9GAMM|nr:MULTISPECIES: DUF2357 domain-containing protein [Psychrobacter]AMT96519.1 hypothetical protein A3K91_0904 [Psychrobacter alimentarius]QCB31093.1 DUF2357 domain-containing protein [Psychrobacter sp. PAMC27889]
MPDLLRIQTPDFELSIWCNDIEKRQKTYQSTLEKREAISDYNAQPSIVRFSPPLDMLNADFMNEPLVIEDSLSPSGLVDSLELDNFIFFENLQYQFEVIFTGDVEKAYLSHRSHAINKSFRFIKANKQRSTLARLTGTINTANDVGWLRLPFNYIKSSQTFKSTISFEVLPTKMSLHDDLPKMYQAIDNAFPLWRFSLVEKTEQDSGQTKQRHQFPLLWLANFSHLRHQLFHALKVISQAPHSRLQAQTSYTKAARIKGKIPARLGAKIKEDLANGLHEQRYQVTKKQLSVDTPENRFIKMVVSTTKKRLADFEYKLRQDNKKSVSQRLSNAFLDEFHQWQQPLQKMLKQGFMANVGDYNGHGRESLVLQQKVGYSSVYRIWQELKFYLDVFDNQSSISMKSVAEIYEVWCFLTLRNILIDELDFKEVATKKQELQLKKFFEYQLKDGFAGAFKFERDDGVKARLAHEPRFRKTTKPIRTYSVSQEPDILLEVTFPNNRQFIWLFDAKYRIKTKKNQYDDVNQDIEKNDYVPDDAINQMHRYRDALIRVNESKHENGVDKSRPVFGAFALYPGYFDQISKANPYSDTIDEISIGAFALLPSLTQNSPEADNSCYWLLNFLRQNIGKRISSAVSDLSTSQYKSSMEENIYLQDAARIPYDGMQQILYQDLTLTLAVDKNDNDYRLVKDGTVTLYTLPKNSIFTRYDYHILKEVRYLSLAICSDMDSNCYDIEYVWPVKKMVALTDHFIFELDQPLKLQSKINNVPDSTQQYFKLTTLRCLQSVSDFNDIEPVYQELCSKITVS